jgi:dolichol-phosphate mannosyltransferase
MKSPAPSAVAPKLKMLSVVIPARDEEGCIASTVEHLHVELRLNSIPHEIIVVDDGSKDRTAQIVTELGERISEARLLSSGPPHGFGRAIAAGLTQINGDAAVVMILEQAE